MAKEQSRNVKEYISGVDFPARRNDILSAARRNDAPKDVMQRLEEMPDREFKRADEIDDVLQSRTVGSQQNPTGGRQQQGQTQPGGNRGQSTQGSQQQGAKQGSQKEGSKQGTQQGKAGERRNR